MKKFLQTLFAICFLALAVFLLPQPAKAATVAEGKTGDCTWTLSSEGVLTISGKGAMENYDYWSTAPWEANDVKKIVINSGVTNIGVCAFHDCMNLTSVTIPSSVTNIGDYAFSHCQNLKNVTIPSSVTDIGDCAFVGCSNIASITIPKDIKTLGVRVFEDCTSLKKIAVPSTVTDLSYGSFSGCSNLTSVELPKNLKSIGHDAFSRCTKLSSIEIPSGVTSIEYSTFSGCTSLSSIDLPKGLDCIDGSLFSCCISLKSIEIPDKVTSIGSYAFHNCTSLTSIDIPNNVTYINSDAFSICTNLTNINIPNSVTHIGGYVFAGCDNLKEIALPDSVTELGRTFAGCTSITSIEIPSSVTEIVYKTFEGCTSLKDITFGSGVTQVYDYAFEGCDSLKEVTFLGAAPEFSDYAFSDVDITAYFSASKGWTVKDCKDYGGDVTWVPTLNEISITSVQYSDNGITVKWQKHPGATGYSLYRSIDGGDFKLVSNIKSASTVTYIDTELGGKEYRYKIKPYYVFDGKTYYGEFSGIAKMIPKVEQGKEAEKRLFKGNKSTVRMSGDNRYKTSLDTAGKLKAALNVSKFDTIIVAYGRNYADALAGSYLAALTNAPILIVNTDQNNTNDRDSMSYVKNYIKENLVKNGKIYVLGGDAVISSNYFSELRPITTNIKRLSGSNRYETNIAILSECLKYEKNPTSVLICDAYNYADSLSCSSLGMPVLLIDKQGGTLTASQKAYLNKLNLKNAYVIGGTAAVPNSIQTEMKSYCRLPSRIFGQNRYETSVKIAEKFSGSQKTVVIAYGHDFPDGLCGGTVAYAMNAPLILVYNDSGEKGTNLYYAKQYFKENKIKSFAILGGDNAVSENTKRVLTF